MAHAAAEKQVLIEPAEYERMASVPQSEQLAKTPEPLCEKGKEQSNQFRSLDHEMGEGQGEQMMHPGMKKGHQRGAWRGKSGLHSKGRRVPKENLGLQQRYRFRNRKSTLEGDSKKNSVGIKAEDGVE